MITFRFTCNPWDFKIKIFLNQNMFNLFAANAPILYPLKATENLWFSVVFRGYKMGTLAGNRLTLRWRIYKFLVEYGLINLGIALKGHFGGCTFKTLYKQHSFLYQGLCCWDSKPSSSKSFSLDFLGIAPITARTAL